jgi:hypothetical protein
LMSLGGNVTIGTSGADAVRIESIGGGGCTLNQTTAVAGGSLKIFSAVIQTPATVKARMCVGRYCAGNVGGTCANQ